MIKVGFVITSTGDGWLGGINYFRNLITAISNHPTFEIEPVIFTGLKDDKKNFQSFPKVKIISDPMIDRFSVNWVYRKFLQKITKKDSCLEKLLSKNNIDVLSHSGYLGLNSEIPTLGWIPDFQHRHLPEFFSQRECLRREAVFGNMSQFCTRVILSSYSAQKDFLSFYPQFKEKSEVLRFIVSPLQDDKAISFESVKEKYKIQSPYILLPNQFWKHKNHQVVVEALKIIKEKGKKILIVCTGNTEDNRNPEYSKDLLKTIEQYGVSDLIKILGILPYKELQVLFHGAKALINPSLFEGWSTTVEEAKAFNKTIILSDIDVHREQDPPWSHFFNPADPFELAEKLLLVYNSEKEKGDTSSPNLDLKVTQFVDSYRKILNKVLK